MFVQSSKARLATVILPCMVVLLMSTLLSARAHAQEVPEVFLPVRATGMGGAFTAISNDEDAIWTNPGGITRIRKARSRKKLHALSLPIIVGANQQGVEGYSQFQAIQAGSNGKDMAAVISETAANLEDKPFWARAAVHPVAVFEAGKQKAVAIGAFTNNKTGISVDAPTSAASVQFISDTGANIGFASSNRTNRLNFGLQLRPTMRYGYDDKVALSTLTDKDAFAEEVQANANVGWGYGVDIGAMYTMADFWYPTLGFAVYNLPTGCVDNYLNPFDEKRHKICGNKFGGTDKNPEALSVIDPTDIRLGLSITPRLTRNIALRIALDGHHLVPETGDTYYGFPGLEFNKQAHAGVELFFGNPLMVSPTSFRAGYNQGFLTLGASFHLSFMVLEFASYGTDISGSSKQTEDRRFIANLSFRM